MTLSNFAFGQLFLWIAVANDYDLGEKFTLTRGGGDTGDANILFCVHILPPAQTTDYL